MNPTFLSRFLVPALGASLALTAVACTAESGDDDAVAASKMAVRKGKDGAPTGDGKTCSWYGGAGTPPSSGSGGGTTTPPSAGTGGGSTGSAGACRAHPDGSGRCDPGPSTEPQPRPQPQPQPYPDPGPEPMPMPMPIPMPMPPIEEYQVGDWFPAPDGCNTCTCTEIGIMCTVQLCTPPAPPPYPYPGPDPVPPTPPGPGCEVDGKPIPAGANVSAPDGCNTCTCTPEGYLACTKMACGSPPKG